jgi:hypothetical protein
MAALHGHLDKEYDVSVRSTTKWILYPTTVYTEFVMIHSPNPVI